MQYRSDPYVWVQRLVSYLFVLEEKTGGYTCHLPSRDQSNGAAPGRLPTLHFAGLTPTESSQVSPTA